MSALQLVVLASGEGTNLQAVIDAIAAGRLDAEIVAVLCNRRDAGALARAEAAEISTVYAPLQPYRAQGRSRQDYDADLAELVARFTPDWVVCLGWMHVLSPAFLTRFEGRVLNLHPALPGSFRGRDGIGEAWEAWQSGHVDRTGCMVHVVVPEVDAGPVLATREVPFRAGEDREAFELRLHAAEHDLVVDVLTALACGDAPAH
ncbi:MAG: phosphoribosylglycinamide formyltransferase [Alphaproteobacteria bacterium]|nr:phosphoribosylglycinamide formyltransferase [Alphaproteobacteria bacterium]